LVARKKGRGGGARTQMYREEKGEKGRGERKSVSKKISIAVKGGRQKGGPCKIVPAAGRGASGTGAYSRG